MRGRTCSRCTARTHTYMHTHMHKGTHARKHTKRMLQYAWHTARWHPFQNWTRICFLLPHPLSNADASRHNVPQLDAERLAKN